MKKGLLRHMIKTILLGAFIIALSACGTKKTRVSSGGTLSTKSQTELISDVIDKELAYSSISGKMNLELLPANTKSSLKTGTYVKLIRDSIIQISIRPILGMEVFRISLTPDSLYILDRMNKKYAIENINNFGHSQGVHFNFYNLQALLTNSLFLPGQQNIDKNNYKLFDVIMEPNLYLIKTADKSGTLYNFAVDSSDRIVSTLILSPDKNHTMQWSYTNFVQDKKSVYPTQMLANIDINKKRFDLKISYSTLDINGEVEIDNSISKKYEKVSIADIINAFIKIK